MSENDVADEITGSIFDEDIDVDQIPDNPNHLPEGVYTCRVTKATLKLTNNKDKVGLTIAYQITEGPYASSFPFTEWLWCPRKQKDADGNPIPFTVDEDRANSRLKKRYEAFGIPADEFGKTKPQDLIGIYAKVKTVNKKQDDEERINVRKVTPVDDEDTDEGTNPFSPKDDI